MKRGVEITFSSAERRELIESGYDPKIVERARKINDYIIYLPVSKLNKVRDSIVNKWFLIGNSFGIPQFISGGRKSGLAALFSEEDSFYRVRFSAGSKERLRNITGEFDLPYDSEKVRDYKVFD